MIRKVPLFALLLGYALLASCVSPPPQQQSNVCQIFDEKRGWYKATRNVERKTGVSIGLQMAFIRQESSFVHNAKPKRGKFLFIFPGKRPSSAKGYSQAVDSTWETYKATTGRRGAKRTNFADAAHFIGWYTQLSRSRASIPLNDPYKQYLAYHEGQGGYLRSSFEDKPQLKRIARSVAQTANMYDAQLATCRRRLDRGVPFVPGL